jgi:hypothetical protein
VENGKVKGKLPNPFNPNGKGANCSTADDYYEGYSKQDSTGGKSCRYTDGDTCAYASD